MELNKYEMSVALKIGLIKNQILRVIILSDKIYIRRTKSDKSRGFYVFDHNIYYFDGLEKKYCSMNEMFITIRDHKVELIRDRKLNKLIRHL